MCQIELMVYKNTNTNFHNIYKSKIGPKLLRE